MQSQNLRTSEYREKSLYFYTHYWRGVYVGMETEVKLCKRCGRRLRSAESKERGYGKLCWEKSQKNLKPLFSLTDLGIDKTQTV